MYSKKRQIGNKGEDIVVKRLKEMSFCIVERNYLRKWGEIDVIAKRNTYLYFFEVKSIQVRQICSRKEYYHPEYNFSNTKRRKMQRIVKLYLLEKKTQNVKWKFILASVYIEQGTNASKINFIEEIL